MLLWTIRGGSDNSAFHLELREMNVHFREKSWVELLSKVFHFVKTFSPHDRSILSAKNNNHNHNNH
jgi:hypothetical protein